MSHVGGVPSEVKYNSFFVLNLTKDVEEQLSHEQIVKIVRRRDNRINVVSRRERNSGEREKVV